MDTNYKDVSPIYSVGKLKKVLDSFEDSTPVALFIAPMWRKNEKPSDEEIKSFQKRSHIIAALKPVVDQKSGKNVVMLFAGDDITSRFIKQDK